MAGKKKTEEPIYPVVPLIKSREEFVSLLQKQIAKGKELMEISVPLAQQPSPYYGYISHPNDTVRYDESAQQDFIASFSRWHDFNLSIYRGSFKDPKSIYYHEYESNMWDPIIVTDIIKDYKDDIRRLSNHMQGDIERVELIECETPIVKPVKETKQSEENPYKVFISHSSKDADFVGHLVDLLEVLGIDGNDKLFCSSIPLYGIKISGNIFDTLLTQFMDYKLYVIFVHSDNYYGSPISLNEMGAAWILKSKHCSFLTKGFLYSEMKGVVNDAEISIKVDDKQAPHRLNQMKDELESLLKLNPIEQNKWEWKRDQFLERVNK